MDAFRCSLTFVDVGKVNCRLVDFLPNCEAGFMDFVPNCEASFMVSILQLFIIGISGTRHSAVVGHLYPVRTAFSFIFIF